jgi:hypothetical protein
MKNPVLILLAVCPLVSCVGPVNTPPVTVDRQEQNPYYITTAANAPLIADKGDFIGSLNYSLSTKYGGINTFIAYKPFSKFGFLTNYSFFRGDVEQDDYYGYDGTREYNRVEFAPGFSTPIGNLWMVECYAGGGIGSIQNGHATGHSTINQSNLFIQPAFGYHNPENTFELGLLCRINSQNFNIKEAYFDDNMETVTTKQLESIRDNPWQYMIEPAVVLRTGGQNVKFQLSCSYSANLTLPEMSAKKFNGSIGFIFKVKTLKNKQASQPQ